MRRFAAIIAAAAPFLVTVNAACSVETAATYGVPLIAPGWSARVVSTGLTTPRGLVFDKLGQLIVVEQNTGLKVVKLSDEGGNCVIGKEATVISDNGDLTHGLQLSPDGKTLYASTSEAMFAWDYDAEGLKLSNQRTVITGMDSGDHTTRTLLLSKTKPNLMIVSRGSGANLDYPTRDISSGRSMIKSFDITNGQTYDYNVDGNLMGWGLRNDIGVAEHPITTGIWAVENGPDEIKRLGVDIHEDNPGEKLNFLGYMNGKEHKNWGSNFGYPYCFSVWNSTSFALTPTNEFSAAAAQMHTGRQFVLEPNATYNDEFCRTQRTAPRLTFEPHFAPLDIKFTPDGNTAFISFHGSWNKDNPAGFKLSMVKFANGEPVEPADSMSAAIPIVSNPDESKCPDNCFRPTGLALDDKQRLYMASDQSGEVWIVTNDAALAANPVPASRAVNLQHGLRQTILRTAQMVCTSLLLCA